MYCAKFSIILDGIESVWKRGYGGSLSTGIILDGIESINVTRPVTQ